jgi:hypothetical protein
MLVFKGAYSLFQKTPALEKYSESKEKKNQQNGVKTPKTVDKIKNS